MRQCTDANAGKLHARLEKIVGQVQAVERMLDEDVPCENLLSSINDTCDVVALLDGAQDNDGIVWQIGYVYATGTLGIGIRADFRNGGILQAGDLQHRWK